MTAHELKYPFVWFNNLSDGSADKWGSYLICYVPTDLETNRISVSYSYMMIL